MSTTNKLKEAQRFLQLDLGQLLTAESLAQANKGALAELLNCITGFGVYENIKIIPCMLFL